MTAHTAMTLDHVQIAIPAGGEDRARAFFTGLLGLEELPKPAVLAGRGGCWFSLGAHELHLGVDPDFRPARKAHVALRTNGLAALRARLEAAGHATRDDKPIAGRQRFFTDDPFGNRLELVELDPTA
jgi:catechol 2,3-dioxygenase-like lactoylglutathione lyase family enzyme